MIAIPVIALFSTVSRGIYNVLHVDSLRKIKPFKSSSDSLICVFLSVSSDDVRSANIIAEENGVECLVIDRE